MGTNKSGVQNIWPIEEGNDMKLLPVFIMPLCCWSNVLHIIYIYICVCVCAPLRHTTNIGVNCLFSSHQQDWIAVICTAEAISFNQKVLIGYDHMADWHVFKNQISVSNLELGIYCVYKTVKHKDSGITSLGITNLTPHSAQCPATAWPGLATPWSQIVWCKWLDPRPQIKACHPY